MVGGKSCQAMPFHIGYIMRNFLHKIIKFNDLITSKMTVLGEGPTCDTNHYNSRKQFDYTTLFLLKYSVNIKLL